MSAGRDVVIRRAGRDDYQAVVDIDDDVYSGMDYLPAMYRDILDDVDSYMLLAELHGKVVAFTNFLKVGPNAVVAMAARTHPSCRGQGIITRLYNDSITHYMQTCGQPILELRTAMLKERLDKRIEINPKWNVDTQWNLLHFMVSPDIVLTDPWCCDPNIGDSYITHKASYPEVATSDTLSQVEAILKLESTLFAFNVNWVPRNINKDNIRKVLSLTETILLTKEKLSSQTDNDLVAFSLTSVCPAKCGLIVNIWLRAKPCDPSVCVTHVANILKSLRDKNETPQTIGLLLHFPLFMSYEDVQNRLEPALGKRVVDGQWLYKTAVAVVETHDTLPELM